MRIYFTDGACKGNPGPGGFGVVSLNDEGNAVVYKYSEQCEKTTNNREELKAILHVYEIADKMYEQMIKTHIYEDILICSDSAYCVNMLNNWIFTWAKNDWKNSKKQTVENLDLVQKLYKYVIKDFFPCQVVKVNGHDGLVPNELADALATNNKEKYAKIMKKNDIKEPFLEILEKL